MGLPTDSLVLITWYSKLNDPQGPMWQKGWFTSLQAYYKYRAQQIASWAGYKASDEVHICWKKLVQDAAVLIYTF